MNVLNMASSKYLNDVIHASVENNSFYNSIPRVSNMLTTILVGIISDWMHVKCRLSLTTVRKTFATLCENGNSLNHSVY